MSEPTNESTATVEVEYIGEDEAWAIFDEQARATLNISGDEFARRWDCGDYRTSRDNRLMKLVILRPERARAH